MRFFVIDIETYSEDKDIEKSVKEYADKVDYNYSMIRDKKIRFGLAVIKEIGKEDFYHFEDLDRLKEFLLSIKGNETIIFIGHNLYGFDMNVIFTPEELVRYFDITFNGSRVIRMRVKGKNIHFFDTLNVFQSSLKKLGEMLGMEKGNLQGELALMGKDEFNARKNEIYSYCENDVLITEKLFLFYLDQVSKINKIKGVKGIPFTSSSYSFRYFNALNNFTLDGRDFDEDYLFLETYCGGRVEAIYEGYYDKPIFVYDVNSLYPYVMQKYEYPLMPLGEFYKNEINDALLKGREGIVFAHVYAPKGVFGFKDDQGNFIDIGLLPLKVKMNGEEKLIFPIGFFYGFFNLNEIRYAMSKGYKVKILYAYLWESDYIPHIKEFVNYFYELKKKHKDDIRGFNAKLILNSLYGKFGQNSGFDRLMPIDEYLKHRLEFEDCEVSYFENYDYVIIRDRHIDKGKSSYFNIASYITSWARIELLKKIEYVIRKGGKIYYMDTDSIFTDIFIDDKEFIGDDLGMMKLDKQGKSIVIYGSKDYEIDNKRKSKGVPNNAELVNNNGIERVFRYHSIIRMKSYLKSENGFFDKNMIKTLKPIFKREMGFNTFLDAINIKSNEIILKKIDNEGKVNYILDKLKLKDTIKVII